uniref:EF-hand domain-containing protein n=1 Tax=Clastoptera arizonana TaxID=38151 RepID=A0A1B6DX07_9HEMI
MDFDVTNCGRVTEEIFRRCLDTIGIGESGLCHLYLAPFEVESIINTYRDPYDSSRILWKVFSQDIESVINKVGLEKRPDIIIDHTLQEITELPPKGNTYSNADDLEISTLESIVTKMKKKIQTRGIDMENDFKDYDKLTTGHVTRNQFRQVLQLNCFLLPDENIFLLERRYIDELGFNYFKFLKDLTFENDCGPRYKLIQDARVKLNAKHFAMTPHQNEKNIVEILAKIKKKLICYKIRLYTFLKQFDPLNRFIISRDDFYRAMDPKLELTETEVYTIMDVFASPLNNCFVEYKRFCETVEETFTLLQLDRAPLLEPVQHVMISDGDHNFLNFEERQGLSLALQKVSEQRTEGLIDIIKV